MKPTSEEIVDIVGLYNFVHWADIDPDVYYKEGVAYGLIARVSSDDGLDYIASCTSASELRFTVGMLRDMTKMVTNDNVCFITDDEEYIEPMKKILARHNMRFVVKDKILYSYNDKG